MSQNQDTIIEHPTSKNYCDFFLFFYYPLILTQDTRINEVNMDAFDRIANEFKEARLPSHKNNPKDVAEKAWEEHKNKHPEMAEFEGALDPETGEISNDRIKENKKEIEKSASSNKIERQIDDLEKIFAKLVSDLDRERDNLESKPEVIRDQDNLNPMLGNLNNMLDHLSDLGRGLGSHPKRVFFQLREILKDIEQATEITNEMNQTILDRSFGSRSANEIIDDLGLNRTASSHSSLIRKVEREIERLTDTPFDIELDSMYEATDIVIQWDRSLVYDKEDEDEIGSYEYIDYQDLLFVLNKIYKLVEKHHQGFVEEGVGDISEGIYRIRIHDDA